MFFLVAGPIFLLNIILANIFEKYQERLEEKRNKRKKKRAKNLRVIFDKHDHNGNGCLEEQEAKSFLADVLDLDYTNEMHRKCANRILSIVETTEDNSLVAGYSLNRFIQFFTLPNFIEIAGLEDLAELKALAASNPNDLQVEYENEQWPLEK